MKQRTSLGKKTLGLMVCLTPVLLMAAISRTDAFDITEHSGKRKITLNVPLIQVSSDIPNQRDVTGVDALKLLQIGEAELEGQISNQDLSLVEKDWIYRFTNRFTYSDGSIDCHISGSQKQKVATLRDKAITASSTSLADQFQLARILRNSRGQDCHRIAFELFLKSAQSGYGRSFAEVANSFKKGLGVSSSFSKALEYFEKSARLGFANSAYRLIELTEKGNEEFQGDPVQASQFLDEFLPLIEGKVREGDAIAARSLGRLYNNSNLLQLDPAKAIRFMRYASDLGDAIAMHDLVFLLIQHRRTELSREAVYSLLLESSRLGYSAAFTALGRLHLKGEFGFLKREAAKWFRFGVDAGHPGAMSELAELYFKGNFVTQDTEIAKDLALQGARLNHRGSKRVLEEILEFEESERGEG